MAAAVREAALNPTAQEEAVMTEEHAADADADADAQAQALCAKWGGKLVAEVAGRRGIEIGGWKVEWHKRTMLNAVETAQWEKELDAFRLPEMVFGNNSLALTHEATGTCIHFNARDALREWKDAKFPPVKVPAAVAWAERKKPSKEVLLDYDYTFTTPYRGSLSGDAQWTAAASDAKQGDAERAAAASSCHSIDSSSDSVIGGRDRAADSGTAAAAAAGINWSLLQRRDPILFFDEMILYEDELADSGIAQLSVRMRVMPQCWFLLLRFWLRVDGSLMRAYDTRLFCQFRDDPLLPTPSTPPASSTSSAHRQKHSDVSSSPPSSVRPMVVVRECCRREESFDSLGKRGLPSAPSAYSQPETSVDRLKLLSQTTDVLVLQ